MFNDSKPPTEGPRRVTIASALASVKSDPLALFTGGVIDRLCLEHKHAWRHSPLGPANTVAMFVRQVIGGNVSLAQACRMAGSEVTPQAYCQARRRLPLGVIHGLFDDLDARLAPRTRAEGSLWHGHRVLLIDR